MQSRVLVVEDDDNLRWLMTEAVSHLGHKVTECSNADDALKVVEGAMALSLIITDVKMPGRIDGIGLAKAVWSEHPELPVIIVSGHTAIRPGFLPANARFINKPCTLNTLSRAMKDLLASH
ncbi:response regulator [Pseudomonas putida]|uniref:response regulator n=1 Tax=Pseudomonas putida group TaxID=136845 RepID=UPI00265FB25E|nr:response regulator [Pseudomonas putida]MDO1495913.1 response regulator [Pseudomonas putida]